MRGKIDKPSYRNIAIRAPQLKREGLTYRQIAERLKSSPATVLRAVKGEHPSWYMKELARKNLTK